VCVWCLLAALLVVDALACALIGTYLDARRRFVARAQRKGGNDNGNQCEIEIFHDCFPSPSCVMARSNAAAVVTGQPRGISKKLDSIFAAPVRSGGFLLVAAHEF
jgi:hypothetical protein